MLFNINVMIFNIIAQQGGAWWTELNQLNQYNLIINWIEVAELTEKNYIE